MPNKEQDSWTFDVLGINVGAVVGAVRTMVQSAPGSAMLPDCKPVKGKVPGPAQHLLCATHGHILDIKEKKIIAVSLEQYKSQKMGSAKPAHAAAPAHGAPPHGPAAATAAPAQGALPPGNAAAPAGSTQAPSNGAASPADADAAKAKTELKKVLSLMQLEVEDIASVRAQLEDLTGGGRLNRAVSWISDKLGGADDPGDELAKIGGQITMEHVRGMAAAGTMNFDAAHKHLDTMKALNQTARHLFQKYTGSTIKGAEHAVTGLTAVSKAGDAATDVLNVVAPGTGQALSIAKNVSVTGSKLAFGQKVNWTEFTVDMAFDLFVGGEGGKLNKAAEKLAGPLAKKLAPKLSEAVIKKLGGKATEAEIEKYIVTEAEELIKSHAKDLVTPVAEKVVESAKDTDVTHGQLVDEMVLSMTNPSGQFAKSLSDKLTADLKH